MGTTVRAFVGGVEAGSYRYLGPPRAAPNIQQLTVQIGALAIRPSAPPCHPGHRHGVASNTDQTSCQPGRVLFVDNLKGNDRKAIVGDITHPFRHVQTSDLAGAWGEAQRGTSSCARHRHQLEPMWAFRTTSCASATSPAAPPPAPPAPAPSS